MMKDFLFGLDRSGIDVAARQSPLRATNRISGEQPCQFLQRSRYPSRCRWLPSRNITGSRRCTLDWTRRPLVAAYFAAVEAADRIGRGKLNGIKHLAVWAFQVGVELTGVFREIVYEAPGATNPNLAAQSGVFTRHKGAGDWGLEFILSRDVYLPGYRLLLALHDPHR